MKTVPETGRRGRPRAFDRDEALDRALELFWTYGYDATSLSALTDAMGIRPPSLYAAFGSKETLFLAALDRYVATSGAFSTRALAEEPTARAAVERLLVDAARVFSDPSTPRGCFVICAATNCAPESHAVEQVLRKRRIASEAALRARIAHGIERGELPSDADATALAKFYAAAFQGMSVQARDGATRAQLEAVARIAMAAWPSGATKTPRPKRSRT